MTPLEKEEFLLVAKACGEEYRYNTSLSHKGPHWLRCSTGYKEWNPKEDDGDALRLAVKLELTPYTPQPSVGYNKAACQNHEANIDIEVPVNGCPHAATRLAIWRAAVAYARGLK